MAWVQASGEKIAMVTAYDAAQARLVDAGGADSDRHFYEGKIAVGSFFAKNFLPLLTGMRQVIESVDNEVMELDEAAL